MQGKIKPQSCLRTRGNTSMPSFDLTVVYRRIETLKPDPANPRLHSKKRIRQTTHSRSFNELAREAEVADAA
jgi:hypothetical protein